MKVLHVILGKANKERANGVNQVIAGLAKYTARNGVQVMVLGKAQTATGQGQVIQRDGFLVTVFTRWSESFRKAVDHAVNTADIVHLHGTYSPLNIWVGHVCQKRNTPYVVTLHGGLSPARNSWKNSLQKRLFHLLLQKRHLERAACIQALTEEESTEIFVHTRPRAVSVIPNGIDLDDFPVITEGKAPVRELRVGYIGRISPEKNLDALCEAFTKVALGRQMKLFVAGPVSRESTRISQRWASSSVVLVGPKYGDEKLEFFDSIDLFVQPSKVDVFSIAAMEALARGVPMVISRTADASHFAETRCFFLCEPTVFGIERALRKALDRQAEWPAMSDRGRRLIEGRLNWNAATRDLITSYKEILDSHNA